MKAGDIFTPENLRVVRPGLGLHPKYYEVLIGRSINQDAKIGTPLSWNLIG
jgi:N-acetylneuraminate synthase